MALDRQASQAITLWFIIIPSFLTVFVVVVAALLNWAFGS